MPSSPTAVPLDSDELQRSNYEKSLLNDLVSELAATTPQDALTRLAPAPPLILDRHESQHRIGS